MHESSWVARVRTWVLGKPRSLSDRNIFHKLSLIAFFAWVGLGADGLSSSCYGPEETFLALKSHTYLGVFVALAAALTVMVISASYSQIIELFPSGGGGYLVASKLLSPRLGVVSGCALLIDYVLTITISIASGADALFSLLPPAWQVHKFAFELFGVLVLTTLNLRGAKEAVLPWVPIFTAFVLTHAFAIGYCLLTHLFAVPAIVHSVALDCGKAQSEIGTIGILIMLLRAYSMGAGTYTGIEAVSNGLPILREPRVQTGKRTMQYMALSLAITVAGLMIAYLLFGVKPSEGKTLNAVLFEQMTADWPGKWGLGFVVLTLASEAALLFVAAQTGFLDGPRVLANMAVDRWFPARFATLSDRLVTQKGILLMGGAALAMMVHTRGSVDTLVVLYSINVFITFSLSQLGMVRHWRAVKAQDPRWTRKLAINGVGFLLTAFILVSLTAIKFREGGWLTLLITGLLVVAALLTKRHYLATLQLLRRLDDLVLAADAPRPEVAHSVGELAQPAQEINLNAKTAVVLVNGFNGLGLHTLLGVIRLFGATFRNFVFVEVGQLDAGNFKGADEIAHLQGKVAADLDRYVQFMRRRGYYAEGASSIGIDVVEEVARLAPGIAARFPQAVFFGGQLVFPRETFLTRWLHNYAVFAAQRRLYQEGLPFLVLPIRV
ncbi:MAG: APC family permease [Verrucomicrobia bacterium]|nr:APC family permease [Verrucomicrobiota bacterium]